MVVQIEALAEAHLATVLDRCEDWKQLAQFGPPYWRPRSSAELKRKIAGSSGPHLATNYTFVVSVAGALVGECSIHAIDWRNGFAQVGVCIWAPDDRRRGYGRNAVEFAIDWGFGYLGLARLEAWIVEGNEPSLMLFRRLGFECEGTLQGRYLHEGVKRAMHIMALTAPA